MDEIKVLHVMKHPFKCYQYYQSHFIINKVNGHSWAKKSANGHTFAVDCRFSFIYYVNVQMANMLYISLVFVK